MTEGHRKMQRHIGDHKLISVPTRSIELKYSMSACIIHRQSPNLLLMKIRWGIFTSIANFCHVQNRRLVNFNGYFFGIAFFSLSRCTLWWLIKGDACCCQTISIGWISGTDADARAKQRRLLMLHPTPYVMGTFMPCDHSIRLWLLLSERAIWAEMCRKRTAR